MSASYQNNSKESPICSHNVPARDDTLTNTSMGLHGHLSAQQIADLCLPGLPITKRRVNAAAERLGWRFVDRIGRGGGRLYAIADLPQAAREALITRQFLNIEATAPRPGRPAGTGYFVRNPDVADQVIAILGTQRLAAGVVHQMLRARFPDLTPPSLRVLQRFMAGLEQERKAVLASLRNPDAYKGTYRLALGRADADATYAGEVWEMDTTKLDVMTIGGRKMVLGLIDRYSRRANFMVDKSESGQSVRRFLIETIRKWGVMPAAVMTDNGSGYINASIKSALDALGIEHRICPPGSPEKKPHIERLFGTFMRDRAEILGGYIGHNVAEAQALRAKARKATGRALIVPTMTPDEVQAVLDGWVDGVYHQRVHGTLRVTPMERWLACRAPKIARPSDDVLRLALSALIGNRTVGKRGIVWKGGSYWDAALAGWMGREVIVRRDEDELGELFIFAPDHSFIAIAVNRLRSGISEEEYARAARAQQASYDRAARAEIRDKQRRFGFDQARDALLRSDAEAAGKLSYLPGITTPASTPAIDSIAAAERGAETPGTSAGPAAPSATPAKTATLLALPTTPLQKVREADAIIASAEAGEPVDETALARARRYQATSEYRAFSLAFAGTLKAERASS